MSEYVLGYILALARRLFELRQLQQQRRWHPLPYRGLRGLVLDAFEEEPLPAQSRLWGLHNCFIAPHLSAVSSPQDIVALFCGNYLRFIAGHRLAHVIDFERGY